MREQIPEWYYPRKPLYTGLDLDPVDVPPYRLGMVGLRDFRKAAGLTQADLAQLARTSQPQIKRLEDGDRKLTKEWAERLAPHLGVKAERLLFPSLDGERTVPLVGYVGAGATAHRFDMAPGELERVPAPDDATENTVAVEIRGDSLGSFFDRWLVYYDDVRRPVTSDLVNRLCVVGLAEDGGTFVKKIKPASRRGLFHLYGQFGDPMLDVRLDWAARVKHMVPR